MAALQKGMMEMMHRFQQEGEFTDCMVVVEKEGFSVHRNVLAAVSPYLREAFKTCDDYQVELENCTAEGFRCFLDYIYTQTIAWDKFTVLQTLQASQLLRCPLLAEQCVDYIKAHLDDDTCMAYLQASVDLCIEGLWQLAVIHFTQHLPMVTKSEGFLSLPTATLCQLLQQTELHQHCTEVELFWACLRWLRRQKPDEIKSPMELIQHVRLEDIHSQHFPDLLKLDVVKQFSDLEKHLQAVVMLKLESGYNDSRPVIARLSSIKQSIVEAFDVVSMKPIHRRTAMPASVQIHNRADLVHNRGILYMIGGMMTDHTCTDMFSLDCNRMIWRSLSHTANAGHERGCFALKEHVYIVGGSDCRFVSSTVERYNIIEDSWQTMNDGPVKGTGQAACTLDGEAYLSGGASKNAHCKSLHLYKSETDTWERKAPMLTSRHYHQMSGHNHKLYIIGGSNLLDVYDPNTDQHTVLRKEPDSVYRMSTSEVYHGNVFIDEFDRMIMLDLQNGTSSVVVKFCNPSKNSQICMLYV